MLIWHHAVPGGTSSPGRRSWARRSSICCMTNYRSAILISAALGLTAVAAFSYSRSGPTCAAFPGGAGAECGKSEEAAGGTPAAAGTKAAAAAAAAQHGVHSHPGAMRTFGPIIRQPALGRHTGSVILLHGLGDTGEGWAPVGPQLKLPHIKFIYPTAPTRPITVNMGMRMPGWFDITHLDQRGLQDMMKGKPFDPEGVAEAVEHVRGLIAEEVAAGIPLSRIVVGGFSQGGHVAYKTVLTHPEPLGGCAALSTWLEPSLRDVPPANLKVPFFCGHGSVDNLIPPIIATTTQEVLEGMGVSNVDFHMYTGMGHSSCPQELRDLRDWLLRVLPDVPPTREEVVAMSAGQLKAFLQSKGVSTTGMYERKELEDAALALLQ